jgi:hypothetical protein
MIKLINVATINAISGGADLENNIASINNSELWPQTEKHIPSDSDCMCGRNYNGIIEYHTYASHGNLVSETIEKPTIKSCHNCESFNVIFPNNGYFTP